MRLIEMVKASDRRLVAPLMGYPGSKLTDTTLKQNMFNWGIQFWSLSELAQNLKPDALFFMMDLSVEVGALGMPVHFGLDESPTVDQHLVRAPGDLDKFMAIDVLKDCRASVFLNTMRLMKENLDIPKGAYCIGPFTLAGLMMGAEEIALAAIDDPAFVHETLQYAAHVIGRYATALIESGADMVAILEPTGVMLSPRQFDEFVAPYVAQLVQTFPVSTILHICGNTTPLIRNMAATGVEGLSLDTAVDFPAAAKLLPDNVALIGNIDPISVLRAMTPAQVAAQTRAFLDATRDAPNLVLSSGCDLPQDTPIPNIKAMIEEGKKWRR
ncbi:MAG TPA: uroporphyrinogen decarboxylase family protein [Candidatus Brocadiia bacterium]|nr:uroporphyrinogen decarboxylase family protein [Candidatus Brocadiia bacterium]